MVLLGRAVYQKAKYLLLDEPTAPLSLTETEKLFTIIKKLKADGMGIVFISHRLDEVFHICEKITVLRDGRLLGSYAIAESSIDKIVEAMLGKKLGNAYPPIKSDIGDKILEVKGLSGEGGIHEIEMHFRHGEIVWLT
jgi:simple sugar transport system ATP-binding protein